MVLMRQVKLRETPGDGWGLQPQWAGSVQGRSILSKDPLLVPLMSQVLEKV